MTLTLAVDDTTYVPLQEVQAREALAALGMPEDVIEEIEACPRADCWDVLAEINDRVEAGIPSRAAVHFMLNPMRHHGPRPIDATMYGLVV